MQYLNFYLFQNMNSPNITRMYPLLSITCSDSKDDKDAIFSTTNKSGKSERQVWILDLFFLN